ncbi:MAG: hypothetical protein A9183_03060 [Dehalococcoides mccartyi]|uniref:hypothetical protein n=1 Tax=Dehalococcoides mccartyi TaxID=61435 RepID=UPI000805E1E6|nr:hypothetical protein [Dehalococcoides mccartyi]OBW61098.1 MAG: hypothetical protein A9183_03060 [Dehalococcoides mccartyi]
MRNTIDTIISILKPGMEEQDADYFVRKWYTGDPLAVNNSEAPAGAVIPSQPNPRIAVFVGEDIVTETVCIRFFQPAIRSMSENFEIAASLTKLLSMVEQASLLLRTDPTFGGTFVSSSITNITPMLPGVPDTNTYRIAEITFEIKTRRSWGQ